MIGLVSKDAEFDEEYIHVFGYEIEVVVFELLIVISGNSRVKVPCIIIIIPRVEM